MSVVSVQKGPGCEECDWDKPGAVSRPLWPRPLSGARNGCWDAWLLHPAPSRFSVQVVGKGQIVPAVTPSELYR